MKIRKFQIIALIMVVALGLMVNGVVAQDRMAPIKTTTSIVAHSPGAD